MVEKSPTKPIIGVTAREFEGGTLPRIGTYQPYLEGVIAAGGAPVVLPLVGEPEGWVDGVVTGLDGILFTGGEDIEPSRYRESPHEKLGVVSPLRDSVELALFRSARARELPILGICRGLQLINVALGGTLYQDLPSERRDATRHGSGPTEWHERSHGVTVEAGSTLRRLVGGERCLINSLHHQAIKDLGRELAVVGSCASDGTIEAIEGVPPGGWLLAVQWHPEVLWDREGGAPHRAIFEELVKEAVRYKNRARSGGAR